MQDRRTTILALALIVALAALAVYWQAHRDPAAVGGGAVAGEQTTRGTDPSQAEIKENNGLYTVDVVYPEFASSGDVNAYIRDLLLVEIEEFKKSATSVAASDENQGKSAFKVTYQLATANEKMLSVIFEHSEYLTGAAHQNSFVTTVNYDLAANRLLELADLFLPDADYLTTLSVLAAEDLKQKLSGSDGYAPEFVNAGTAPKTENYQSFSLAPTGITLYFDPYQVAAYSAGPQEVFIFYEELTGILDPDGPANQV